MTSSSNSAWFESHKKPSFSSYLDNPFSPSSDAEFSALKLSATIIGLWEGIVTLHFTKKRPKSTDPYVAWVVRMFVDFLATGSMTRVVLIVIWTALGMVLADVVPGVWHDVGMHRVWRRFRRDIRSITRTFDRSLNSLDLRIPKIVIGGPRNRVVRFSPTREPSVIPEEVDRQSTTIAAPTSSSQVQAASSSRRRTTGHYATGLATTEASTEVGSPLLDMPASPATTTSSTAMSEDVIRRDSSSRRRTAHRVSIYPDPSSEPSPSMESTNLDIDDDNLSATSFSYTRSPSMASSSAESDETVLASQTHDRVDAQVLLSPEDLAAQEEAASIASAPEIDVEEIVATQIAHDNVARVAKDAAGLAQRASKGDDGPSRFHGLPSPPLTKSVAAEMSYGVLHDTYDDTKFPPPSAAMEQIPDYDEWQGSDIASEKEDEAPTPPAKDQEDSLPLAYRKSSRISQRGNESVISEGSQVGDAGQDAGRPAPAPRPFTALLGTPKVGTATSDLGNVKSSNQRQDDEETEDEGPQARSQNKVPFTAILGTPKVGVKSAPAPGQSTSKLPFSRPAVDLYSQAHPTPPAQTVDPDDIYADEETSQIITKQYQKGQAEKEKRREERRKRIAEERKKQQEEEAKRRLEEEAEAERQRIASEEKKRAEEEAEAERQRIEEEERIRAEEEAEAERQRIAEEERIRAEEEAEAEEKKRAEAAEAERQRVAEEEERRRVVEEFEREEKKRAEEEKERKKQEKKAQKKAQKEKEKLAAAEKKEEEERLAEEKRKEEERLAEEKRQEEERLAEEKRKEEKLAEEKRLAEEARLKAEEEARAAEEARLKAEKEAQAAEEARLKAEAEARAAEEAEAQRLAEEARLKAEKEKEEADAEAKRLAEAEEAKLKAEEEEREAEAKRIAEEAKEKEKEKEEERKLREAAAENRRQSAEEQREPTPPSAEEPAQQLKSIFGNDTNFNFGPSVLGGPSIFGDVSTEPVAIFGGVSTEPQGQDTPVPGTPKPLPQDDPVPATSTDQADPDAQGDLVDLNSPDAEAAEPGQDDDVQSVVTEATEATVVSDEVRERFKKTLLMRAQKVDLDRRLEKAKEVYEAGEMSKEDMQNTEKVVRKYEKKIKRYYREAQDFATSFKEPPAVVTPVNVTNKRAEELVCEALIWHLKPDADSFKFQVQCPSGKPGGRMKTHLINFCTTYLNVQPDPDANNGRLLNLDIPPEEFEVWLLDFRQRSVAAGDD